MPKLPEHAPETPATEQDHREAVQSPSPLVEQAPNGEGALVAIDSTRPWAQWPSFTAHRHSMADVRAVRNEEQLHLWSDSAGSLGVIGPDGVRAVADLAAFPADFVQKLPMDLRGEVISNRLRQVRVDREFQIVNEGGQIKSITPGIRAMLSHAEVAQTAFNAVADAIEGEPEVKDFHLNGHLDLTIMTPMQDEITPAEGDVLRYGITFKHRYGQEIEASIFAERLVCINGAIGYTETYTWNSKQMVTRDAQLDWITQQTRRVFAATPQMTEHARTMARTQVEGDINSALDARAEAMRIPRRYWNDIHAAFEQEPGQTEWHLVNAVTRFASHTDRLSRSDRRNTIHAAGNWAGNFDIVTARMPRPVAVRSGAQIIEAVEA
jgi:hypothetical protein